MTQRSQRVGLALSGGGARGFAHIGVLRVLERVGLEVDVIAGTSMGAILGALYAYGYRADDLYDLADDISWRDIIDFSLQAGLIKGEKLHRFLSGHLPKDFQDLQKPFVVATTDVETGEEVLILRGDLITAVRASSCFPGAFEPVQYQGRTLADGGIINNLPVGALSLLGSTFSIASDATPPRRTEFEQEGGNWWERLLATMKLERRNPMAQMLLRLSDIMQRILTDMQYPMHPADVRIMHRMPQMRLESFWAFEEIVELGEQAALSALRQAGLLDEDDALRDLDAAEEQPDLLTRSGAAKRALKLGTDTKTVSPDTASSNSAAPNTTAPNTTAPNPSPSTSSGKPKSPLSKLKGVD